MPPCSWVTQSGGVPAGLAPLLPEKAALLVRDEIPGQKAARRPCPGAPVQRGRRRRLQADELCNHGVPALIATFVMSARPDQANPRSAAGGAACGPQRLLSASWPRPERCQKHGRGRGTVKAQAWLWDERVRLAQPLPQPRLRRGGQCRGSCCPQERACPRRTQHVASAGHRPLRPSHPAPPS